MARNPTPETPGGLTPHPDAKVEGLEKIMILQSPLDPRIPIDSLDNMVSRFTRVHGLFAHFQWRDDDAN